MNRLRVRHTAGFRYEHDVSASHNESRMLPRDCHGQQVLSSNLDISPPAPQFHYSDYWGTRVVGFEVLSPHRELTLTASSLVEVDRLVHVAARASWTEVGREAAGHTRLIEHSGHTARTRPDPEVAELAREVAARADDPFAAATGICEAIGDRMEYVTGVTGVNSTAADAWSQGRGVCQDITHVALGALRSVGIPARYVSGYMQADTMPQVGVPVLGESHAWVEWYSGSWVGFDPTNLLPIATRHILVARGRDYDDIAPIRGVYAGKGASTIFASVEITRET